MRRREFIAALGGTAAVWPLAARAQQGDRMRRIGVLMGFAESDPVAQARFAAFREGLQNLGWAEGRNIRVDTRWATPGDVESMQRCAKELVALQPELVLSSNSPATTAILQLTRTIPIIIAVVADPVGSGFVASFPRPAATSQVSPISSRRSPASVHDMSELESVIASQAREPNGGLIAMPDSLMLSHGAEITSLAARYRLPAVYPFRFFAELGGLLSFGSDQVDNYRRAATYVDKILNGAKPSELPVQGPVKFELVINLKTAKALGLKVPPTLLATANAVIE
jgi:putative ABC transport system substrate-binding protein